MSGRAVTIDLFLLHELLSHNNNNSSTHTRLRQLLASTLSLRTRSLHTDNRTQKQLEATTSRRCRSSTTPPWSPASPAPLQLKPRPSRPATPSARHSPALSRPSQSPSLQAPRPLQSLPAQRPSPPALVPASGMLSLRLRNERAFANP